MNWKTLRPIVVSGTTLLIVYLITAHEVDAHRKPGSMTVIEAQSMDMNAMSANTPVGSIPVAVEDVAERTFAPTVTYTGSGVAFNDINVYPRVTGTLVSLMVYPGDHVRAGEVVARLDSAELASKADEAADERIAMQHDVVIATEEQRMAAEQEQSAEGKASAGTSAISEAGSQVAVARASRDEAVREQEAANASVADAKANAATAQADAEYWRAEIVREHRLFDAKAVSRDEFDRETAQAKTAESRTAEALAAVSEKTAMAAAAKSRIGQADAGIAAATAHLSQARAEALSAASNAAAAQTNQAAFLHRIQHHKALVNQAEAQERTADIIRGYTEIRADRDGNVTERLVSPGTLVQPGTAILRIESDDRVRFQASVAETDLTGIRVGSAVTVTKPRDPTFRQRTNVTSIFSAANAQTRTVTVEAVAPNPGRRALPGEYIVMEIATATPRQAITVPMEAVRRDVDQRPFVWTVAVAANPGGKTLYTCVMHPQIVSDHPGKCPICGMTLTLKNKSGKFAAHRAFVTLGPSDGKRIVVENGLEAGEQVIYRGQESVNEGDPVSPVAWGASGPKTLPRPSGDTPNMPGMSNGNAAGMENMPGMGGK